jgi:two-component system KDP operon response regulator KdpE
MRRTRRSPDEAEFGGALEPNPIVLIVDSDPATGRMLRVLLEAGQCRVLWARSLAEGLAEAVDKRPDAIVLELDLPDCDGYDALGALRERTDAPVLILSERASIADKIRALDAGANDFVSKPFAPEELAARLRVLLRRRLEEPGAEKVIRDEGGAGCSPEPPAKHEHGAIKKGV